MNLRLFCYRFLICSNIYTLIIVYSAIIATLAWFSLQNTTLFTTVVLIITGLFSWSFLEYTVHRFLFHGERASILWQKLQYFMHGYHHIQPRDPDRLVLPFILTLPISLLMYFALLYILPSQANGFVAGFLLGYISYDITHYTIHRLQPSTFIGKYRRSYHYHHHFKNQTQCFGVTSPLWDYVFKTQWHRD